MYAIHDNTIEFSWNADDLFARIVRQSAYYTRSRQTPEGADPWETVGLSDDEKPYVRETLADVFRHLSALFVKLTATVPDSLFAAPEETGETTARYGFSIEKEDMVCEDGKYYVLMDVKRAEAETEAGEGTGAEAGLKTESPARDAEFVRLFYGDSLIRERNPVLAQYLKEEEQMLMKREASLRQSAKGSLRAAERLMETETRLKWNREVQDEMQRDH